MVTLTKLYKDNYKLLFRVVNAMTLNVEDTLDILQETFLKAFVHYNADNTETENLKWLIVIAKNTTYTFLKKNRPHEPIDKHLDTMGKTGIELFGIFIATIKETGTSVPAELYDHLIMHITEDVSLLSISKKTDISYERLRYWKKILIRELKKHIQNEKKA